MKRFRSIRDFGRDEGATAAIEFVVTLPMFLAMLAFAFEFGQLFLAHQTTVNNVRSAARFLSRVALTEANENRAERIIRTGQPDPGITAPPYLATACVPPRPDCIIRNAGVERFHIEVRVNYPLTIFSLIGGNNQTTIPFVVVEDVGHMAM